MNNYQGAGGGWNVSPQVYHDRQRRKTERYQRKHGLKPKRIRPSRVGRIVSSPFRLLFWLLKVALILAIVAAVVYVVAYMFVVGG